MRAIVIPILLHPSVTATSFSPTYQLSTPYLLLMDRPVRQWDPNCHQIGAPYREAASELFHVAYRTLF